MASIVKLRWYNLADAILFSAYGFFIEAYPVAVMNFLIVCANIYNLKKMHSQKEDFKLIEIKENDELLLYFLDLYQKDIRIFLPDFLMRKEQMRFFVLRDMVVAGIFIGSMNKDGLKVELDYALPKYRDFKVGAYLYKKLHKLLEKYNIHSVYYSSEINSKYIKKMDFVPVEEGNETVMIKSLKKP